MITKAIVEEILSPYEVKVRVPVLDRCDWNMATSPENLNTATVCSLPNCYVNLKVGDIVFVGFEDNTYYKAVVLGHLCREAASTTYADLILNSLTTHSDTILSSNTTIGNVTAENIKCLEGVSDNIQRQLNYIKEQLDILLSAKEE